MFNVERSGEETRKLSHNNDRCVGCGICTDVCPTSSLRLGPIVPIARGLIEMDLVSVTSNTCVLCGLCSVACPFDALSLTINGNDIKKQEIIQYGKLNQKLMMMIVYTVEDVILFVLETLSYLKESYRLEKIWLLVKSVSMRINVFTVVSVQKCVLQELLV